MRFLTEYNPNFLTKEFVKWLRDNIRHELESPDREEYHYNINDIITNMEDSSALLSKFGIEFNSIEDLKEQGVDYIGVDLESMEMYEGYEED
jgi:calcineurin-like phosphoesterase